jgi:Zincin-like metallopeptidase
MPHFDAFKDSDCFYTTSFHELGHWTGHKDRLDRNLRNRFGRQAFTGWIGRLSMLHSSFFRAWRRSPSCYSGSPYRKPNRGSELAEDAADGRISREAESKPPSSGRLVMALMATVLVATGVLVLAWVLVLIINLAPLATHASHSIDVGLLTRHISWVSGTTIAAIVIFVATYLVIAIGKLPGYQLDRAGAALVGASFMVGAGVVSLDQAYRAIDFDAITLLLRMMIVVANLRLSGFFRLVTIGS